LDDQRANLAIRPEGETNPQKPQHHKAVLWAEVPNLLKEINLNRNNFHPMSVPSTKLYALTFLRAGALTRLQWRWINKVVCILCLEIPGDTSGSKEIKAKKIIYRITYPSQKRYKRFLMFLNCIKMRVTLSLYL
tara:strand:- start:320 stop:721 length:402 start_codon:yes stop_codon:yes gene_type:complete